MGVSVECGKSGVLEGELISVSSAIGKVGV